MARVTRSLFARPEQWIHRRVEYVSFKDHRIVHHQIGVDFTLPRDIEPISDFEGKNIYIAPLFVLAKDSPEPLREGKPPRRHFIFFVKRPPDRKSIVPTAHYSSLSFTDQEGHSLPILTRLQSAQLTAAMLLQEAERVLGGRRVTGRLQNEISVIPYLSWLDLQGTLAWLKQGGCGDARAELRKDELFAELVDIFASHYLIACLLTGNKPRRPIYKLSYDEHLYELSERSGASRRSVGWSPEQYFVPLTEIGASSTYHVEVAIPDELEITEVGLVGKRYRWFGALRDKGNRDYIVQQVQRTTREGKVYIPAPLPGRRTGLVWVKLRARRQGFLRGALAASFIITAMLFFAAFAVLQVVHGKEFEAATATLLLVPALVAAYIARPGEHAITTKMLRWARAALFIDALLPGVAIYLLLTERDEKPKFILKLGSHHFSDPPLGWLILAGLSFIVFVLFVASNIFPQPRGETFHRVEGQH